MRVEGWNLIVYIVREGYEVKTWIKVDENASDEKIEVATKEAFDNLGVKSEPNDYYDYEWA